jgi:hypothetical protein
MTEILEVEQQELKLPMSSLHDSFGVCWDKKDTYTITKLTREDFNGKPITVNSVLKLAGINFTNDKQTIIVFDGTYSWKKRQAMYFNIDVDKKVNSYSGVYRKGDVLPALKTANDIVVIEADYNSLKYRNSDYYDNFYRSRNFNSDSSLYERVRIKKHFKHMYNEKTREYDKEELPESEVRAWTTRSNIDVQFLSSGRSLELRKTVGNLRDDELWGEMIDKSGYNRNAKLVDNHFKLRELKANKIRKKVKNGEVLGKQVEVIHLLQEYHNAIGNILMKQTNDVSKMAEQVEQAEDFIHNLRWHIRNLKGINESINEVSTKQEYIEHTLSIGEDLDKLKEKLTKEIEELN